MGASPHCIPILEARGVGRVFGAGELAVRALHPTDLSVGPGEVLVLRGPSGSGKTTLLSILGMVLTPSEGDVWLGGCRATGLPLDALASLRLREVGFVFQQFNLIAGLSAHENVELPLRLSGVSLASRMRHAKVMTALDRVSMAAFAHRKPRELSGGQQQRVAIARALVTSARLLLCDEPTASLDSAAGEQVLGLLREIASGSGRAVVVVTHDRRVLRIADRVLDMRDGAVVASPPGPLP
ncbi:MAG: ABC transporter ATP-binding protein [Deltaproteobacteria bacterium]|nr:ABC transporter ATP-binding protein [Nannocystaceae bacterium]